jgi:ribosomal-protein-alanine N-acetyltransferase
MPPVSIECARPEDATQLAPVLAHIAALSFPDAASAWSEQGFAAELRRPITTAWVARDPHGRPVGYLLGWEVEGEAQILSFAVEPDARGSGVGRDLLWRYLEELRRRGTRRVTLEVRASNTRARALYASAGLCQEGSRPRYYAGEETALLYGARL